VKKEFLSRSRRLKFNPDDRTAINELKVLTDELTKRNILPELLFWGG